MARGSKRNPSTTKPKAKVATKVSKVEENEINKVLTKRHRLKCKNEKQKQYANLITEKEIVIASGPAGTGKSYVSIARALELLQNKTNPYKKLIISKPAVEAEENHGFLPGGMKEKMEPYVSSSVDIIDKIIGKGNREKLMNSGHIEVEALAYIRGKSIDGSILIMEECQNMSPNQVKTLLTRIGENTKFILSGDIDQSDKYKNVKDSGLFDVMSRHRNVEEIGFFEFEVEDIVRNPIICKILKNYQNTSTKKNPVKKVILNDAIKKAEALTLKAEIDTGKDEKKTLLTENKKVNKKGLYSKIKSFFF